MSGAAFRTASLLFFSSPGKKQVLETLCFDTTSLNTPCSSSPTFPLQFKAISVVLYSLQSPLLWISRAKLINQARLLNPFLPSCLTPSKHSKKDESPTSPWGFKSALTPAKGSPDKTANSFAASRRGGRAVLLLQLMARNIWGKAELGAGVPATQQGCSGAERGEQGSSWDGAGQS